MNGMQPLAELEHIALQRGNRRVFDDLTLHFYRGQNTAILGPNGAGKSSLLKLLTSELRPLPGGASRMRLLGSERWVVSELRQHFGLVSQDLQEHYAAGATGLEVVLSGLYGSIGTFAHQHFDAAARQRATALLQALEIGELEGLSYMTMSTGQRRRCLLARALIHDPELLILDEPTAGLDLAATFDYLQRMRSLMQQGRTLLLVTHHLQEIMPEIERVVLLKAGRVVADGPKRKVLTSGVVSELYATPVHLVETRGWYHALPA
jgi:iron complex transport system ATP-binding protein